MKFARNIKRAVFVGSYSKAVERLSKKSTRKETSHIEETPYKKRPVPFYNWLKERDSFSEICSGPNLENWLNW